MFYSISFIVLTILVIYHITMPRSSWANHTYTEILPPGWQAAEACSINDNGIVTGSGKDKDGNSRGFLYRSGTYKTLIPPGWEESYARGINDSGAVVGNGLDREYKGFLYDNGTYTDIMPPGWREAYAQAINNDGVIAGYGREAKYFKGFIYSNGKYTDILPQGWREAYAQAINSSGAVAGYGLDENNASKGFIYKDGAYRILLPPGLLEAKALDINDRGDVVGFGLDVNNKSKSFIYRKGIYADILSPGWQSLEAYSINNNGVVTGWGSYKGGDTIAFLYDGASFFSLLPPGWKWTQAYAVNARGEVIGYGSYGLNNRGFVATAIPRISIDPMILFFGGNVKTGSLMDKPVTVKNEGTGELVIGKVTTPSSPFSIKTDNCSGRTLSSFETCTVIYGFIPATGKKAVSSSNIPSNDPVRNPLTVTLGVFPDNDGDGYTMDVDCNDNDPSVNPEASEIPHNNKDDDCDPETEDNREDVR